MYERIGSRRSSSCIIKSVAIHSAPEEILIGTIFNASFWQQHPHRPHSCLSADVISFRRHIISGFHRLACDCDCDLQIAIFALKTSWRRFTIHNSLRWSNQTTPRKLTRRPSKGPSGWSATFLKTRCSSPLTASTPTILSSAL